MARTTRRIRRAAARRRQRAWRGMPRGRVLKALTTSSLALPGMAAHAAELGELGYTADYKFARYTEDDITNSRVDVGSNKRYEIDIHQLHLGGPLTERLSLDLDVAHEVM